MCVLWVGLKKVYKALIRLAGGRRGSIPPSDVYVRSFLCPFFYFDKTLLHTHTHTVWLVFSKYLGLFFFSTIQFILRLWMVLLSSFCFPQILLSCLTKWYQTHGFWNATNLCIYSSMHSHSVVSNCCNYGLQPARLLCPWDFPGKNTEVGCHFLLQGNFPTQGLKLGVLPCRQILYNLSRQ